MYAGLNSSSALKSFFRTNPRTNKARTSDCVRRVSSLTLAKRAACHWFEPCHISVMSTAIAKRKSVKAEALKLVRGLPESSTWDDIMYRIYVRQKIESGLSDIRHGRVHSHASIRKELGLS